MRTVHRGPAASLVAGVLLLGLGGAGPAGWVVGTGYAVALAVLLTRALRRCGADRLGPANAVTLTRATLVGTVTALVADSFGAGPLRADAVVPLAAVALALDGVDGWVARRTRSVTALGGRFDMEVDAFLILVLSVPVSREIGLWVLLIGAARYLLWAAGGPFPWTRATVPARYWRKPVAAIQGIVLTAAVAELLPRPAIVVALLVALGLLTESFGRDVVWLWRRARTPTVTPVRQPAAVRHGD